MNKLALRGRTVLVTGASSGIGLEMARLLAGEHGANLVIVARRQERLEELARELRTTRGVDVTVTPADLSKPDDVERVIEAARDADIEALILNAGITHFGPQVELEQDTFERMLAVNVTSLVRLSTSIGGDMTSRGRGAMMFVASLAGLQPVPYQSAYSGTKGFVVNYGRSLQNEFAQHGVSVTTFCPGGIRTEMTQNSGLEAAFDSELVLMSPDRCAKEAVDAMVARTPFYIPGAINRATVGAMRFLPSGLVTKQMGWQYRRALKHRK